MTLDSEEQRQILLHLLNTAQFPGSYLEKALELKQSLQTAKTEQEG